MPRRIALLGIALFSSFALLGASAEVFGRPLRGLSMVPLAEIVAHPESYRERAVRVAGTVAEGGGSKVVLSEGSASLPVESDGSFALPALPTGSRVAAEGKLRTGALVFAATGLEVRR